MHEILKGANYFLNTGFCGKNGHFWAIFDRKSRKIAFFFKKKVENVLQLKKKALPLHSLYDSNDKQINVASLAQLARARDL